MSNFKLNLPTDIPWERICVTEDMIDRVVCDERLPSKWQSSLAVFKYVPEDECQLLPNYNITYLKVTATITGYQPLDKEIQGNIDWHGVNVSTIPGLKDLLNSYNPCHGAILQVVVGPPPTPQQKPPITHHVEEPQIDIPLKDYPFFLDFEPKKRELYELATDTKEKQSRSIESLNITKSGGSTQSMEVLDVDMGGSVGFGMQGSYAGTGGGFNVSSSSQGQWGTKRLNAEESMSSRSTDVGQEKRESFSFSTQLSQMYHLLDSYHLGTNRVVFFIQPRPHVLEEPTGFVRGPRPVEGIQEFFMIVAHSKEQKDFCVSLRLDTSHLTKTPIMDYERKSETTSIASASPPVASKNDTLAEYIVGARACFGGCWDVHYQCYRTEAHDSVTYNAPSGYRIESYNDLINEAQHGSTNVVITPNGASLNINVEASGHKCYETGDDVCINCDDEIQAWAGSARRQVQVNLVSTTPTKQIGEEEVMLITTRGLCCCPSGRVKKPMDELVVGVKQIPSYLKSRVSINEAYREQKQEAGIHKDCPDKKQKSDVGIFDTKYTIRQANELSNFIKTETIKSLNDPYVKLQKFIETDFFAQQLEYKLRQIKKGRAILNDSAAKNLPKEILPKLEKHFGKDAKSITRYDIMNIQNANLARITGIKAEEIQKLKLTSLGVKFHTDTDRKIKKVKEDKSSTKME